MPTLSVRVDEALDELVRIAAHARKMPVSRFLNEIIAREVASRPLTFGDVAGLGQGAGELDPSATVLDPYNDDDPLIGGGYAEGKHMFAASGEAAFS